VAGAVSPEALPADDGRDVVVVCARGPRAVAWAAEATASGRTAIVLDGGMQAWEREGLPII
jgi:rhodanese-related sulfurtransferase